MFLLPAAIGTYLLVNILCAAIALGVGFAVGVWYYSAHLIPPPPPKPEPPKPNPEAQRTAERVMMASSRLADLAQGMASDVGAHSTKVEAISDELHQLEDQASGTVDKAVFTAINGILSANTELQQRLAEAERQIEAQAVEIRSHQSAAQTDSLTQIANRRAFDDEMRRRLAEWERNKTPFTLLLLDIDHFKRFNDTHGHQAGDEVLRQVAEVLRQASREMDVPCRYGGEEFAVILPATEATGARTVAERIREAIEAAVTQFEGKTLKVTSSMGLAQVGAGDDAARLIKRADEALYKSKEAGRNCGHWHDGQRCRPFVEAVPPAMHASVDQSPPPGAAQEPASVPESVPEPLREPELEEEKPAQKAKSTAEPRVPRMSFVQTIKRRVTESHRFGVPLSLMHVKIEEYDAVSRSNGKAVGQQMVETAARAIERALRDIDVLARHDHGEFLILLPGTTLVEANQVARRIRISMSNCVVPLIDRELNLRFRHGAAQLQAGDTTQELLARARRAMPATAEADAAARV